MTEVILTQSQNIGIQKIERFLNSDEKYFRLTGPPGSGKTFLIKHAISKYLKKEQDTGQVNVVGITLAHQAKNVLQKASINNCRTFAQAYGFKEKIRDDGSRIFTESTYHEEPPVGHLDIPIFVHDEISQYSKAMMDIVFSKTSAFSKVILMGDAAQLPPIDPKMKPDEDSPMFFFPLPDWCQHNLTERVRQKEGHPILDLSDIIREEIFGSQNINRVIQEILRPKLNDGKGYLCLEKNGLYHQYLQSENFLENKILAFRKFKVHNMNIAIRSILFPHIQNKLTKNDLVLMTNNFKNESPPFKLMNSDQYIITKVDVVKDYVIHCDKPIECYYGEIITEKANKAFIITPTENGQELYAKTLQKLEANGKQNRALFKHKFEFIDSFCDYSMGYSINAYKCQGSTYKNVFIDLIDILETGPLTTKRKLQTIYTTLTRATDIAYFIKP